MYQLVNNLIAYSISILELLPLAKLGYIGSVVAALMAVLTYLHKRNMKRSEYIEKQLNEFYNPIYKFLDSGKNKGRPIHYLSEFQQGEFKIYTPKEDYHFILKNMYLASSEVRDLLHDYSFRIESVFSDRNSIVFDILKDVKLHFELKDLVGEQRLSLIEELDKLRSKRI